MKLVVHSLSIWSHPNLRTWEPDDPLNIAEEVSLEVGSKGKKASDIFFIKVATPKGLKSQDGVIAMRPLLILSRYDYHVLWNWITATVSKCEGPRWNDCVSRLQLYFTWEYEQQHQQAQKVPSRYK